MKKFIILDRDGVINQDSKEYIKSPEEWQPISGSLEAIVKLNQAGFTVIIASNQSGVGRGYFDLETLKKIHQKMNDALAAISGKIDKIYFCPHKPEDNCECRKPKTGLFQQIAKDYKTDLHNAITIGDSRRDIQAGLQVGCRCILVKTGKGEQTIKENHPAIKNIQIFDDLAAAVEYVIGSV